MSKRRLWLCAVEEKTVNAKADVAEVCFVAWFAFCDDATGVPDFASPPVVLREVSSGQRDSARGSHIRDIFTGGTGHS